jgi:hypothetical protein
MLGGNPIEHAELPETPLTAVWCLVGNHWEPEVYGYWALGPLRQRIPDACRSCAAVGYLGNFLKCKPQIRRSISQNL